MGQVSVKLNAPWPSPVGLRRPQEGIISVTEGEAEMIKNAGAGEIVTGEETPKRTKSSRAKQPAPDTESEQSE